MGRIVLVVGSEDGECLSSRGACVVGAFGGLDSLGCFGRRALTGLVRRRERRIDDVSLPVILRRAAVLGVRESRVKSSVCSTRQRKGNTKGDREMHVDCTVKE